MVGWEWLMPQRVALIVNMVCRHAMYYGRASETVEWFAKLGYTLPYRINAADFILDLSSADVSTDKRCTRGRYSCMLCRRRSLLTFSQPAVHKTLPVVIAPPYVRMSSLSSTLTATTISRCQPKLNVSVICFKLNLAQKV